MLVARSLFEFSQIYNSIKKGSRIGFVPTMGALHKGHLSLVTKSLEKCNFTIVSIFVNPTQFNNPNDLKTYPRVLETDYALLRVAGADLVFVPEVKDIYPETDTRVFNFDGLDNFGEGPTRPGHFNGVAQVVTRLFDIVKPTQAFFGEKDFQQLAIIQNFTKKLGYNIEIVSCDIYREKDGLAMSSRNSLLTTKQRVAAPHIYASLIKSRNRLIKSNYSISVNEFTQQTTELINTNPELECEYIEVINADTLQKINSWEEVKSIKLWCAVYANPIRLIDNINLR